MIRIALLSVLLALPLSAVADRLACRATDGLYVESGKSGFSSASSYDPTVLKSVFYVERSSGTVIGSALYRTEGKPREVVRNDDQSLELLLRTSLGDTFVLKLQRTDQRWTFTHYSSWLNLLLVGTCEPA